MYPSYRKHLAVYNVLAVDFTNWLQLLKLYEEEMKDVVSLVEQMEVSNTRVTDYLHGLKSIGEVYNKVSHNTLKSIICNFPNSGLLHAERI